MADRPGERRIVVGVDGSAASMAALRWAGPEARLRGASVHVVRAWEDHGRHRAPYASPAWQRAHLSDRDAAAGWLQETAKDALGPQPGMPTTVEVADGLAARILLDRAEGADLLVLGSRSHSAPDTLGPVAQVCLRHAPCPVVIVSAEQQASSLRDSHRATPAEVAQALV